MKILHRYTGKVLWENPAVDTLVGADLYKADLREADLREADLREADLDEANLYKADLRGANLDGANLSWANLREADLREANLGGANLGGANLSWAGLRWADLGGANLGGANLGGAILPEGFASREDAIAMLDKVREAVLASPNSLEMSCWHTCETTHCIAGWVQHLSGVAGDTEEVGIRLAWPASHMFFASNGDARKFLEDRGYAKE